MDRRFERFTRCRRDKPWSTALLRGLPHEKIDQRWPGISPDSGQRGKQQALRALVHGKPMSELTNHLSELDLEHCKDVLVENGIELLQDVAQLTADDLEGLGLDAADAAALASSLSGGGAGSERQAREI